MQSCFTDEGELCSTEEEKSECAIRKQKDAKNEVTCDVPNYFNTFYIFKCGGKIFDRLDVSYEIVSMASPREEEFTEMLNFLLEHNHRRGTPLSSKYLQKSFSRVLVEEENIINITSITLLQILCFSPASLSMHKRKMET